MIGVQHIHRHPYIYIEYLSVCIYICVYIYTYEASYHFGFLLDAPDIWNLPDEASSFVLDLQHCAHDQSLRRDRGQIAKLKPTITMLDVAPKRASLSKPKKRLHGLNQQRLAYHSTARGVKQSCMLCAQQPPHGIDQVGQCSSSGYLLASAESLIAANDPCRQTAV